jgi:hypothetical protein
MAIINDYDGKRYTAKKAAEHVVYQKIYARHVHGVFYDDIGTDFPDINAGEKQMISKQIDKLVARLLKWWKPV